MIHHPCIKITYDLYDFYNCKQNINLKWTLYYSTFKVVGYVWRETQRIQRNLRAFAVLPDEGA